jgi:polysaccharide deacetylase 2 family uncharacterized protein YibQ
MPQRAEPVMIRTEPVLKVQDRAIVAALQRPALPPPPVRFGQEFVNPHGKPVMSIVLLDEGEFPLSALKQLYALPLPVSIAVDSGLPDAAARVAAYQGAGIEVMATLDPLVAGSESGVAAMLGQILAEMGSIVGVLEGTEAALQRDRRLSDPLMSVLARSGHGLVTRAAALPTLSDKARRRGIPTASVFQRFDTAGPDSDLTSRYLREGAFQAVTEGTALMLGKLSPDALATLMAWRLQHHPADLVFAPVSAVLLSD